MGDRLHQRFSELWARTTGATDADGVWRALDAGYAAAGRRYHNWDHIADLLSGHDAVRTLPDLAGLDGEAIDLAIFFHDAVYEVERADNEARSAQLLVAWAGSHGGTVRLQAAEAMIQATAAHGPSADPATRLLLDLDLAILAAAPSAYAVYAAAIRQEYAAVPDAVWCIGRVGVLDRFIARPRLYQTDHFHDRLEASARANLAAEAAAIRIGIGGPGAWHERDRSRRGLPCGKHLETNLQG